MKILFGSVVYQAGDKYLDDFFSSIDRQTDKNFSVLLLNDDMDMERLKKKLSKYAFDAEIIHIQDKTPVQLRIELIRRAKQKQADLLIMGDCDDFFSDTRVIRVVHAYINNPDTTFFYHELRSIDETVLMPKLPEYVKDFRDIGEYNFLGLSNTALNVKHISFKFIDSLREYDYEIFDWYLFSRLLLEGACGKKVTGCFTIYRLHENNLAGIQVNDRSNIERELDVKIKHYENLRKYHVYFEEKYHQFQNRKYHVLEEKNQYYWWNLLKSND